MRIASLLPSATEIIDALGAGDDLVCVTHKCPQREDAPRPVVTSDPFAESPYAPKEIAVFLRMFAPHLSQGAIVVDEEKLAAYAPEVVFVQGSCDVCAPSGTQAPAGEARLGDSARVITLQPHSLGEVLADIRRIGQAIGRAREAEKLLAGLRKRMMRVMRAASAAARQRRQRVVLLEWVDPPMAGGLWLPELIEAAGGLPALGARQVPAVQTPWRDIVAARPEVLLISLASFPVDWTAGELRLLRRRPEWPDLPAVASGNVYVLDGQRFFHAPVPRIIDSLELLASILHPDTFGPPAHPAAVRHLAEREPAPAPSA